MTGACQRHDVLSYYPAQSSRRGASDRRERANQLPLSALDFDPHASLNNTLELTAPRLKGSKIRQLLALHYRDRYFPGIILDTPKGTKDLRVLNELKRRVDGRKGIRPMS
jgi:hypothetical protein